MRMRRLYEKATVGMYLNNDDEMNDKLVGATLSAICKQLHAGPTANGFSEFPAIATYFFTGAESFF